MFRRLTRAFVAPRLRALHASPVVRDKEVRSTLDPSEVGSPTIISLEEATAIMDAVRSFINLGLPGKRLDNLVTRKDMEVHQRWTAMMEIRIQTELHVINAFGFESSQMGMLAYRQTMASLMQRSNQEELQQIQKLDKSIWSLMLSRAFQVTPKPLELQQARQVVFMVTSALQQTAFLVSLKAAVDKLGDGASDSDKNTTLQVQLLDVWKSVLPQFGFSGDEGYVQFQAALVQHSADSDISTMIQSALMSVSQHSGLRG